MFKAPSVRSLQQNARLRSVKNDVKLDAQKMITTNFALSIFIINFQTFPFSDIVYKIQNFKRIKNEIHVLIKGANRSEISEFRNGPKTNSVCGQTATSFIGQFRTNTVTEYFFKKKKLTNYLHI